MPYVLVPPKVGRSPFWRVRGTEYGIELDRSTKVADKTSAAKLLKQWRDEAKRQHLAPPDETRGLTFADAALSYLQAGRSQLFVKPLLLHFGDTLLSKIGQAELDVAAAAILPDALPQTRNRSVYTPTLAIMRHAGVVKAIKRPRWTGGRRLDWLRPDDAFKLLNASTALLRETKNGESIAVHLPQKAVAALANLGKTKRRVFGLTKCARLYALLDMAEKASGIKLAPGSAFHTLRHSHAMWRRLFAGADTAGLVASGLWKSRNRLVPDAESVCCVKIHPRRMFIVFAKAIRLIISDLYFFDKFQFSMLDIQAFDCF